MAKACPTCMAVEALLATRKVPGRKKIAYSPTVRKADKAIRKTRTVRKVSGYQRKLQKHLRKERDKATKKNGQLRKGMTMAKVMKNAHKCVQREMRKK